MLDYIQLGDKIEMVTELDNEGNQEHYYSSVQGKEDGCIIITAPTVKGRLDPLEIERTYGMCVYTKRGLYRCEVELVSRERRANLFLLYIQINTDLKKYQRRQYYRMDCMLQFNFKNAITNEWYRAIIVDISGGGLRFYTDKIVREGDKLLNQVIINIKGEQKEILLSGKVVYAKKRLNKGLTNYEIREHFDTISDSERDLIIKYIFDEERRRRRNKVN